MKRKASSDLSAVIDAKDVTELVDDCLRSSKKTYLSLEMSWNDHVDNYFKSGISIKEYANNFDLSYAALKYHVYKDERYIKRLRCRNNDALSIIPAVVVDDREDITIEINGFKVSVDNEDVLKRLLTQMRSL